MRPRLPRTLSGRLLAATFLLLLVFLSVTAWALDLAFRESADRATRDLLRSRVLGLLAAADIGEDGELVMRGDLPEERLLRPASGLYARVISANGRAEWTSPSLAAGGHPAGAPVAPGEAAYDRVEAADGTLLARLRFGVAWDVGAGVAPALTVSVAESLDAYFADLARFRGEIGTWFAGFGIALLAVQWWLVSVLLKPLRQAEREVAEIEHGARESLSTDYPAELEALTSRLNALVASERSRARRYRETLDNLAHSLRTPLAVVRSVLSRQPHAPAQVGEALDRMDDILAYQLSRAAASGEHRLGGGVVPVRELVSATADALAKVHAERPVRWELDVPAGLQYLGQRGDLAEILGNLMENACKWARGQARVRAGLSDEGLAITVEDDGPGFGGQAQALLARGARGDTARPGHGIGLAVVRDIVADLGGRLLLDASELGGARVDVHLPPGRGRSGDTAGTATARTDPAARR